MAISIKISMIFAVIFASCAVVSLGEEFQPFQQSAAANGDHSHVLARNKRLWKEKRAAKPSDECEKSWMEGITAPGMISKAMKKVFKRIFQVLKSDNEILGNIYNDTIKPNEDKDITEKIGVKMSISSSDKRIDEDSDHSSFEAAHSAEDQSIFRSNKKAAVHCYKEYCKDSECDGIEIGYRDGYATCWIYNKFGLGIERKYDEPPKGKKRFRDKYKGPYHRSVLRGREKGDSWKRSHGRTVITNLRRSPVDGDSIILKEFRGIRTNLFCRSLCIQIRTVCHAATFFLTGGRCLLFPYPNGIIDIIQQRDDDDENVSSWIFERPEMKKKDSPKKWKMQILADVEESIKGKQCIFREAGWAGPN